MAGGFPQIKLGNVGGVDDLISPPPVLFFPEMLDDFTHKSSFGMPVDESRPAFFFDAEEVKFPAQPPVVPPLDFFKPGKVGVQGFLVHEGGAVDALEHGPVLVSPPVSSGDAEQLERLEVSCIRYVRACAKIEELPLPVYGHRFAFRQLIDQFKLVGLSGLFKHLPGFLPGKDFSGNRQVLLGYSFHFLLNGPKVFRGKPVLCVKIVIEAVFYGRPYPQACPGKQAFYRLSQHMGCGMPQRFPGPFILEPQGLNNTIPVYLGPQFADFGLGFIEHPHHQHIVFPSKGFLDIQKSTPFGHALRLVVPFSNKVFSHFMTHLPSLSVQSGLCII